ncbi:MAG: putative glycolipid-binding domain-containing protein [Kiloniellales bacterium]
MSDLIRNLYWSPWDEPGLEHLHLKVTADGAEALGLILRMRGDQHFRCRYELETDPDWRVRQLTFAVMPAGGGGPPARIELESDGQGSWRANGEPQPELEGCLDLDIQVTPFTNTLPVRRLGLEQDESAQLRVVYLALPELKPRPVEQRYTCLAPIGKQGGLYRYEGLFRDFTAELPVDGDGLVMDYPETFRRVWPT